MRRVFSEINRVLKEDKYFCLIVGQGKGKITEGFDTIGHLEEMLITQFGYYEIFRRIRKISNRNKMAGVSGVNEETILIFKKR